MTLGFEPARTFLTELLPGLSLLQVSDAERSAAIEEFLKRSRRRRLSLCDCLSFVLVGRRLAWAPCLSFDEDFASSGLPIVP